MAITQKTVLITGCSAGGIGAAVGEEFLRRGWHVFATARTPSKIPDSLAKHDNTTVVTLDVTNRSSISDAVDKVSAATGGKLDVLFNNSGQGMTMPALDQDIDEAKRLFDVNVWAVLAMIQAFAPLLVKAKGTIVNNGSIAGKVPAAFNSIYNCSKACLNNASESWRLELAPLGVRVITLITGTVETEWFSNMNKYELPDNSYYKPIADGIADLANKKIHHPEMPVAKYAKGVVDSVERRSYGPVWLGNLVFSIRYFAPFIPDFIFDRMLLGNAPPLGPLAESMKYRS